jgi:hypothetical protein
LETPTSQQPDRSKVTPIQGQRQPLVQQQTAVSERISYKQGQDISLGFTTEPDVEMYEFLKEYVEFRIARMKKPPKAE